jgi:hypothetical protein
VFLFIENLAGLHIATHSPELATRRLVKFVTPGVVAYAEPALHAHGWVITVPQSWVRVLKPLISLTQLPVIQQDPCCWAFRLGRCKHVLSDGLLTEFIVKRLRVPVKRFYSIASVHSNGAAVVPGSAIIGSNWLEFGSMTLQGYRAHLEFLQHRYPDALYYCHPKERSDLPEQVFGAAQVRRPDRPVEALLRAQGIPQRLVGVCSSSMLALAAGLGGRLRVDMVCLTAAQLDGARGDSIYELRQHADGLVRVGVEDLQQFLLQELAACGVQTQRVVQTTSP